MRTRKQWANTWWLIRMQCRWIFLNDENAHRSAQAWINGRGWKVR